ncbi:hypothetical protein HCN52_16035, partial [Streptomyces bohaiensis]|nr:hypothetical protein [Streptomyces bohaiensis]
MSVPGDARPTGARRPRRGGRRERLRSVLVAAVPSALILGMGVVPGPAAADVLQPPYPFRAGPCAERSDPAATDADEADGADDGGRRSGVDEAGEGREPPEDPAPPEPDDGDPPGASPADGGASGTEQDADAVGGPGPGPTDRAPDREADREPEETRPDDRGAPAPPAPDDTAAPDDRSADEPQEPPVVSGDRPAAPHDTDRPRPPSDPLGLGAGLRDLTDGLGSILLPGADRTPRGDRPAAEPGSGGAAGDPADDGA